MKIKCGGKNEKARLAKLFRAWGTIPKIFHSSKELFLSSSSSWLKLSSINTGD